VVLAGQSVASRLRELPYAQYWMIFVVPVDKNSRRASRIGKLDPFPFFPHAQHTMFLDFKLALLWKPAKAIKALLLDANASFAAFAHPCVSKSTDAISECRTYPGDPLKPFIFQEITAIIMNNITEEMQRLLLFENDLKVNVANFRTDTYIDGALLVRDQSRFARELSCNWQRAYSHSPDRDQLSFPVALGFTKGDHRLMHVVGALNNTFGRNEDLHLKHWWLGAGSVVYKRSKFAFQDLRDFIKFYIAKCKVLAGILYKTIMCL